MADSDQSSTGDLAAVTSSTAQVVGVWTFETLKAYEDMQIRYERELSAERDRRYQERWQAQEAASKYAQEKSNEFRGALDDVSTKQATKDELRTGLQTLSDKIDVNERTAADKLDAVNKQLGELRSRLDVGNPLVGQLQSQYNLSQGALQGGDKARRDLIAAVSIIITILLFGMAVIGFLAARTP